MHFSYSKLRGRIREVCGTDQHFAELMDMSSASISSKLNNKTEFSQQEIFEAVKILGIDSSELSAYFFTPSGLENLNSRKEDSKCPT